MGGSKFGFLMLTPWTLTHLCPAAPVPQAGPSPGITLCDAAWCLGSVSALKIPWPVPCTARVPGWPCASLGQITFPSPLLSCSWVLQVAVSLKGLGAVDADKQGLLSLVLGSRVHKQCCCLPMANLCPWAMPGLP